MFVMNRQAFVDSFKPAFKYYKQKAVKPSFENVVDFNSVSLKNVSLFSSDLTATDFDISLGLKGFDQWKIYHSDEVPGLYFIPNPFTEKGKSIWIDRCLNSYCRHPHKTNLTVANDSIWEDTCAEIEKCSHKDLLTNADQVNILKTCPVWKLRWATLGLHHDWNSKVYSRTECSPFPSALNNLTKTFAGVIGWRNYESQEKFKNIEVKTSENCCCPLVIHSGRQLCDCGIVYDNTFYLAEAAIVNYYHVGSTLSPHTDHSEEDLAKPLISISFGLTAIFLIGGSDKSTSPTAFFIRCGDVVIMSGTSRLAYHAVPKILESKSDSLRTDPIEIFKAHSRLNINVRQFQS